MTKKENKDRIRLGNEKIGNHKKKEGRKLMKKKIKSEKGAIAALVVVTVLMFALILMGTYMAITNLRKSQLESDIRIQQLYGGDVDKIEEVYNTVAKNITGGLEVGDYINYNSGENGVITCRVLYEVNSEYGLQIISDKNVKDITLGGNTFEEAKTSYNNAIATLNNEAEKYINTNYVMDARCVGSVPTVENGIFVDKNSENPGPVTLEFEYNGSTSIDCKGADENYVADRAQMKNANIWRTEEVYWLASRYLDSQPSSCGFGMCRVNAIGELHGYDLCYVDVGGGNNSNLTEFGLRPCFSLKTDIKITGGDGSKETPYIME